MQNRTGCVTALPLTSVSSKHDLWAVLFPGSFSKPHFKVLERGSSTWSARIQKGRAFKVLPDFPSPMGQV